MSTGEHLDHCCLTNPARPVLEHLREEAGDSRGGGDEDEFAEGMAALYEGLHKNFPERCGACNIGVARLKISKKKKKPTKKKKPSKKKPSKKKATKKKKKVKKH